MRGDCEEASHRARSLPLIPKANFILDCTDTFFANQDDRAANALPRGVDVSRSGIGAQMGLLPPWTDTWARDPQARVSHRGLTLTPVTPSFYAGPLRIRTGRGFHDRYDDLLPTFPLKNLSFLSLMALRFSAKRGSLSTRVDRG
jgi:hypothetical protein